MRVLCLVFLMCVTLSLPSTARAQTLQTLTFDELPAQSVDGLSFMGVTFGFQVGGVSSADARYNIPGPGDLVFVQGAILEGAADGVLTMDFAVATETLQFGIVRDTLDSLSPAGVVALFDSALQPLGTFSVDATPLLFLSEGQFQYSGVAARRAVITFNNPTAATRFGIDNLSFRTEVTSVIPEPGAGVLLTAGLLPLVGAIARRCKPR